MPKLWTLSVSEPWFTHLKNGRKIYEGRLLRGLVKYMQPGDHIDFYSESETLSSPYSVSIVVLHKFQSFKSSLESLPLDQILPNISSIDEGTNIYLQFASEKSQSLYGVCQIEIKERTLSC